MRRGPAERRDLRRLRVAFDLRRLRCPPAFAARRRRRAATALFFFDSRRFPRRRRFGAADALAFLRRLCRATLPTERRLLERARLTLDLLRLALVLRAPLRLFFRFIATLPAPASGVDAVIRCFAAARRRRRAAYAAFV